MLIRLPFPALIPIVIDVIVAIFGYKSGKNISSLALNSIESFVVFGFFYDAAHVIRVIP